MNEDNMNEKEAALMRSRLHIRAAKKLLNRKKYSHAIGTFYDAFEYAMRYYYLHNQSDRDDEIIYDVENLFHYVQNQDIMKSNFDFKYLQELLEYALEEQGDGFSDFDSEQFLDMMTSFFENLTVLPFEESDLPEEDEDTKKILGISS